MGKEARRSGRRRGKRMDMMTCLGGHSYKVQLQADRMPGAPEAKVFTDSYKHMEHLGGMRLLIFLILFKSNP